MAGKPPPKTFRPGKELVTKFGCDCSAPRKHLTVCHLIKTMVAS